MTWVDQNHRPSSKNIVQNWHQNKEQKQINKTVKVFDAMYKNVKIGKFSWANIHFDVIFPIQHLTVCRIKAETECQCWNKKKPCHIILFITGSYTTISNSTVTSSDQKKSSSWFFFWKRTQGIWAVWWGKQRTWRGCMSSVSSWQNLMLSWVAVRRFNKLLWKIFEKHLCGAMTVYQWTAVYRDLDILVYLDNDYLN